MRPILLLLAVALIGCGEDCECPTGPGDGVSITIVSDARATSTGDTPPDGWEGEKADPPYGDWFFYPVVLVTDLQGNPLANKRVDWEVLDWTVNEGEGSEDDVTLVQHSTLTNTQGKTASLVYFRTNRPWVETIRLKATVFGYNVSVVIEFGD